MEQNAERNRDGNEIAFRSETASLSAQLVDQIHENGRLADKLNHVTAELAAERGFLANARARADQAETDRDEWHQAAEATAAERDRLRARLNWMADLCDETCPLAAQKPPQPGHDTWTLIAAFVAGMAFLAALWAATAYAHPAGVPHDDDDLSRCAGDHVLTAHKSVIDKSEKGLV